MLILLVNMRGKIHSLIVFSAFHKHPCQMFLFEVFCGNAIEGKPTSAHGCVREMGVISTLWQVHCSETISSRVTTAHTVERSSQTLPMCCQLPHQQYFNTVSQASCFQIHMGNASPRHLSGLLTEMLLIFHNSQHTEQILTTVNSFPIKHCFFFVFF